MRALLFILSKRTWSSAKLLIITLREVVWQGRAYPSSPSSEASRSGDEERACNVSAEKNVAFQKGRRRGFQRAGEKMVGSDLARLLGNLGATISYNTSFLVTAAFVNYLLRHNFCLTATCNCKIFMATEVAS